MARYAFGDFVVDTDAVEVRGPGGARAVEPQVFDVLALLLDRHGALVTKEDLLDEVWGDRFVSESALTTRIKQARRALDDDGATQWTIKTVHGRGYRFVAPLREDAGAAAPPPPLRATDPGGLPDELRAAARTELRGRTDELATCLSVLDAVAAEGRAGWIGLLGEPGIGKTRLAAAVAEAAHARGHRVVFGRNSEDLRVPHQPFIEIVRSLEDDPDALPAALAPLLPTSASTTPSGDVDAETRRYELFEATATWLAQRAAEAPLLVVVDDVHWAAESTMLLLASLRRRVLAAPVTFLLTARDTAPDEDPRTSDLVSGADAHVVAVRLPGLGGEEVAAILGASDGEEVAEALRQTAGNPLLLQAIDVHGGAVDLRTAVRRRLANLADDVQSTLRLLSVLGLEVELTVAAAALGRGEMDVLDDLERAVAARLLDDIGGDRFRFTHALVRSSLREELSAARRTRLHASIAEAIVAVFGDDPAHRLALAFHTAEAADGDPRLRDIAVERLRAAASDAVDRFSYEEAVDLLARAIGFVGRDDHPTLAAVAFERGRAGLLGGRNVDAAEAFVAAMDAAREAGDVLLEVESAIRYEDALWRHGVTGHQALDRVEAAQRSLQSAIDRGEAIDDEALAVRLEVARFRALSLSDRRAEAEDRFPEVHRRAVDLGSPDVEAVVVGVQLAQVRSYERAPDTARLVQRLDELLPLIEDSETLLRATHDRLVYATLDGDLALRRRLLGDLVERQERQNSTFWDFVRAGLEAMEAQYHGELEAAEMWAQRSLELAPVATGEDGAGMFGLRMFTIRREQDRLASLAPLIRRVVAGAGDEALWTPGLALLLAETGDVEAAMDVLEPLRAAEYPVPADAMWSTVMVLLIETVVAARDEESCRILADRFAPMAGTNVVTGSGLLCFGRADRYLGMLALVLGDLEAAEAHLGEALEGDSLGGSVVWSNESRLWLSRVRRAQGHEAEADAMVGAVLAEATAAGLARLVRLAQVDLGG